ncbi:MAG: dethiobiotin synthase [Nitrospirota bacterium]
MAKGFFVTGTDTGVGKTIITGALILALRRLGINACGMKPLETGCLREGDILVPSDGMFIKTLAHMEESVHLVSPCCFEKPLAPLTASQIERTTVDFPKIKRAYTQLRGIYDAVVIEGIGGLLVPIRRDYSVLDLAKEFMMPLVIVAKPGLGTLNHTMLTVECAIKAGLPVAGIIINYHNPPEDTLAEETNPETLTQICPVPVIGIFPYLRDFDTGIIEKAVVKNLNLEIIRQYI